MQKDDYRSRFGISQSAIKQFMLKSPKKWKALWIDGEQDLDKNEDNFTMGSLIDTMLFSPDTLNDRFYIGEEKLPSKAVAIIIKNVYDSMQKALELSSQLPEEIPVKENLEDLHEKLLYYANNYKNEDVIGWNNNWKAETRISKLIEQGTDYFNSLCKSQGRKIISPQMNMEAIQLCEILRTDSTVKDYFVENADNLLLFQHEIFIDFEYDVDKKIPLKGALDIVRFDHKNKTVQIIDFKSSYSAHDFIKSIKQYGYCDQLSFYDYLLREWLSIYCEGKYCGYQVIPPINIVIDISDKIPYVYKYNWNDLLLSSEGNREYLFSIFQTHDHNMKIKKGWKSVLKDIAWHYFNNKWDKPKEMYENGFLMVNLLNG